MPSIPRITKSDIRRRTDNVYFQRGQKYYEQGAIYDQRRQEMMLKSKCSGSQAPFYRQEVLLDAKGIISAECSCPVGGGGHCKHAVALLLTWINDPDSFQEVEAIEAVLDKCSKSELIAIIKQRLEQEPDLESLLELPILGEENKPINIKAIRQQAQRAFQGNDYEWGYAGEIKRNLNPLLKLAADYLSREDAENSALIFMTVIETIMDNENAALGDEEGELLSVSYDCAESLGECLGKITNSKKRKEILQILFSVYRWDTISAEAALEARGTAVGVLADSLERAVRGPKEALSRGDLCLVTPYSPSAGFSVGAAMGRNRLIYCLADYAIVVASDADAGGTWAGATETLKNNWVPVFVLEHDKMPEGNKLLLQKGALAFPHPFKEPSVKLPEWMKTRASSLPSQPSQPDLF